MPAASLITITNATVTLTLGGGTPAPIEFSCQISTASLDPTANLLPVEATFCAPATQVPAATAYILNLVYYQDWGKTDSLSQFLFDNDTALATFEIDGLVVSDAGAVRAVASGEVRLTSGAYGGAAGAPLTATVGLPVQGKPTIGPGVATAAASSDDREAVEVG